MAGRGRGRGARRRAGGGGNGRGPHHVAAGPHGADQARGAQHPAGRGGGARGPNPNPNAAARPHGPRAQEEQIVQGAKGWPPKNLNRVVQEESMIVYTGTPFKNFKKDYTSVKLNNKRLMDLYAELEGYQRVMAGAASSEVMNNALEECNHLWEEVHALRAEIIEDKGMALPVPKRLKKMPKSKK